MTQESDQPGEEDDDSSPQTNGLEAGAGPLKLPEMSPPPIPWFGAADGMPVTGPLLHQHIDVQAANEAAAGDDLLRRQKFLEAGRRYRQAIRLDSHNEKYHAKLGAAARNAGQPEVAERHLLEAIRLAPHYAPAHQSLTLCYMASGQVELALKHADAALALDPMDIDFIVSRAAVLDLAGRQEEAWEAVKPIVEAGSLNVNLGIIMAGLARKVGRERQCLALIDRTMNAGLLPMHRSQLHFAAAALLDKMGEYDRAFSHARQANELRPRRFDPSAHKRDTDRKIEYFTHRQLRSLPKSGADSRRVVLIVGMPRSGTSLVEQILASHPGVFGGGESMALDFIILGFRDGPRRPALGYPECLDMVSMRETDRLARQYLSTVESPGGAATFVTDKMPLNCMHLGLVQVLLPQCRVIHCTRSSLDTCVSCYFTDFMSGNPFANDLEHLARAFHDYQRLMAHWSAVVDLPIHNVRYEDLVLDVEGQARRMLEFLGLAWDAKCLNFHKNPRSVKTASREQVRQPPYLSSVDRWRNYEKHIGKLIQALAVR
jgi:tetratricopeptide (TPR) repeat protein